MRVQSIFVENYGPFKVLEEMRLGPLATIVGQNDVGKSNISRGAKKRSIS
jgi:AAA15 family ATPase/GTPase